MEMKGLAKCLYSYRENQDLGTPHAIPAIQTFIASAAPDGDMSAGITGRCIALHAFCRRIYSVQACLRLYRRCRFGGF